jgi:uncharacterized membrane protein
VSSGALRKTMIVVTAVGLGWATYLTYVHYSGAAPLCSLKGDPCAQVQKSQYSELLGIPVALIGSIGYLLILGSLLLHDDERTRFATTVLTLGGFGFSMYLTYREVFTLHKICEDCVASAAIMTLLMGLSVWRFLQGDDSLAGGSPDGAAAQGDEAPASTAPLGATRS